MPTVQVWLNDGDYVRVAKIAAKKGEPVSRTIQAMVLKALGAKP